MKSIWEINLGGNLFAGIDDLAQGINELERAAGQSESAFDKLFDGEKIHSIGSKVWGVRQSLTGINDLAQGITDFSQPFLAFDQASRELQSVTNITEEVRAQINAFAKDSAVAFGGDATKNIDIYTTILSKLGPELSQTPEILKAMGDNVARTSLLMKGDTAGAVNVLTTAMNQYGVSIENPTEALANMTEMMNTMQASALVGSSELPDLQAGIAASGATAKASGVAFDEMTAALQVLDKGSKKGAEGGVALRNTLSRLSEGRFMPEKTQKALLQAGVSIETLGNKSIPLADRLKELSKIQNDAALVSQFFGTENMAAGQYLLDNIDLLRDYTQQINENKNAAENSANTIMTSWQKKIDKMHAWFNNWKLGIAESIAPVTPLIIGIADVTGGFLQMAPGITAFIDLWGKFGIGLKLVAFWENMVAAGQVAIAFATATAEVAMAQFGLTTILATGGIILAIGAVVAGVIYAWNHFEGFRKFIYQLWASAKEVFKGIGTLILDYLKAPVKLLVGLVTFDVDMIKSVFTDPMEHASEMANNAGKAWDAEGQRFDQEAAQKRAEEESRNNPHYGEEVSTGTPYNPILKDAPKPVVPKPNPTNSGANPAALGDSGSSKQGGRNITVHITKLVEQVHIHAATVREGASEMKRHVADALLSSVGDFETRLSQQPV